MKRLQQPPPFSRTQGQVPSDRVLEERLGDAAEARRHKEASYANRRGVGQMAGSASGVTVGTDPILAPGSGSPPTMEDPAPSTASPPAPEPSKMLINDLSSAVLLFLPTDTLPAFAEVLLHPLEELPIGLAVNIAHADGTPLGFVRTPGSLSTVLQRTGERVRLLTNDDTKYAGKIAIGGTEISVDPGQRVAFVATDGEELSATCGSAKHTKKITASPNEHWRLSSAGLSRESGPSTPKGPVDTDTDLQPPEKKSWCTTAMLGTLSVVLILLLIYFFWRQYGSRAAPQMVPPTI